MKTILTVALACGLFTAAPIFAEDLTMTLINESGATIKEFYTSPVNTDDWEEDVFGDTVMPDGRKVQISIRDGSDQCDYDILIVFADGSELTDVQDLCTLDNYTITPD